MLIIWWGNRTKLRKVDSGHFHCPHCGSGQQYNQVQVIKQETLFSFIPIGRGEEVDRYIECVTCKRRYESTSFHKPAGAKEAKAAAWECPKCGNHNPNSQFQCLKCKYSLV